MRKNAEFLIHTLTGMEIPGSATIDVTYKNLVDFAEIYGIKDLKYVGSDEKNIVACHAFANRFVVISLYELLIGIRVIQDGKERPLALDPDKILHAGNEYNWEGSVDIKPGDKLTIIVKYGDVWVVEETMVLFGKLHLTVTNQNGEVVCKPVITSAVRPGGY